MQSKLVSKLAKKFHIIDPTEACLLYRRNFLRRSFEVSENITAIAGTDRG